MYMRLAERNIMLYIYIYIYILQKNRNLSCLCVSGLWLHLEVEYTGALQMTLETKINLSKLGKEGVPEAETELETINVL